MNNCCNSDDIKKLISSLEDEQSNLQDQLQDLLDLINTALSKSLTPDDVNQDDLTIDSGILKFADRTADNSLSYVIVRGTPVANDPDDDCPGHLDYDNLFDRENTIYEIRYVIELHGRTITMPKGCILRFNGGRIDNGTVVCDNTGFQGVTKFEDAGSAKYEGTFTIGLVMCFDKALKYWDGKEWVFVDSIDEDNVLDTLSARVVSVTTSAATASASVNLVGTELQFKFALPKGDKGEKGDQGAQGAQGEQGNTGSSGTVSVTSYRYVVAYKASVSKPATPYGGSWDAKSNTITYPSGWSDTVTAADDEMVWQSSATFSSDNVCSGWSEPFCISGNDGAAGQDGVNIEFIYKRATNESVVVTVPSNNRNFDDYVPTDEGWTDHPLGVNSNVRCEYVCSRKLVNDGGYKWSEWYGPSLWSSYGKDGKDGDGIEYVYIRTNSEETPDIVFDIDDSAYNVSEYLPKCTSEFAESDTWTDDPTGVNSTWFCEYVSIRKWSYSSLKWGSFSAPALWSKYGKDGENGEGVKSAQAAFTSFVFTRNNNKPATPTGGSYANPLPNESIWSDGVPEGTAMVWMSKRIFTWDGNDPQDATWSTPTQMTDTASMDVEWSAVETKPGTPTANPYNWHNDATTEDVWMAVRFQSNGEWGAWNIMRVRGEKGDTGTGISVKGSLDSVNDLPTVDNTVGDTYIVNGMLYVWDGDSWHNCGTVKGEQGAQGKSSFTSFVFSRAATKPATPVGGNYANPLPDDTYTWSDGVPDGSAILWMSKRVFWSDNVGNTDWTDPQQLTDTSDFDVDFSSAEDPGTPATNPNLWSNDSDENTIWMATRVCKNGVWSGWQVTKIKGEDGASGTGVEKYELHPSTNIVLVDKDGNIDPSSISCWVRYYTNDSYTEPTELPSNMYLRYSIDGSAYTVMDLGLYITISTSYSYITFYLMKNQTVVDQERIPIVKDGSDGNDGDDGESPIFADLDNEVTSIPADENGVINTAYLPLDTTVSIYRGIQKMSISSISVTASSYYTTTTNTSTGLVQVNYLSANAPEVIEVPISVSTVYNGTTYTRSVTFTINKSIKGATGDTGEVPSWKTFVYKKSDTQPSAPTSTDILPSGWSDYPTSDGKWWMSVGVVDGSTSKVTAWSTPVQCTGEDGDNGGYTEFRFAVNQSNTTAPSLSNSVRNPSGWTVAPPTKDEDSYLWMITATIDASNNLSGTWSSPTCISGEKGQDGEALTPDYKTFVFKQSTSLPSTPSGTDLIPSGWSDYPTTTGTWWMSVGSVDGTNGKVTTWSTPVKCTGTDGTNGTNGTNGSYYDFKYAVNSSKTTAPTISTTSLNPGSSWSDTPPTVGTNQYLWMTKALKSYDGTVLKSNWSTPVRISGEDGDDGTSMYLHIKFSNDGGLTFTDATSTTTAGETPGKYIGYRVDYTEGDYPSVDGYTWSKFQGDDGYGYEYIYKTTSSFIAPVLPATNDSSAATTDGYVLSGWSADPITPTLSDSYLWMAWRVKVDGIWSVFKGTGLLSDGTLKALLFAMYAEGTPGQTGAQGPIIYPAGYWDATLSYKADSTKAPYVLYNNEYYLCTTTEGTTIGAKPNAVTDGSWTKMDKFEAIYTSILLADNALIGSAVFNGDYMFSQTGYDEQGLSYTDDYEYFNPDDPLEGNFVPNVCINFKTGEAFFANGKVLINSDGTVNFGNNITIVENGNTLIDGVVYEAPYRGGLSEDDLKYLTYKVTPSTSDKSDNEYTYQIYLDPSKCVYYTLVECSDRVAKRNRFYLPDPSKYTGKLITVSTREFTSAEYTAANKVSVTLTPDLVQLYGKIKYRNCFNGDQYTYVSDDAIRLPHKSNLTFRSDGSYWGLEESGVYQGYLSKFSGKFFWGDRSFPYASESTMCTPSDVTIAVRDYTSIYFGMDYDKLSQYTNYYRIRLFKIILEDTRDIDLHFRLSTVSSSGSVTYTWQTLSLNEDATSVTIVYDYLTAYLFYSL